MAITDAFFDAAKSAGESVSGAVNSVTGSGKTSALRTFLSGAKRMNQGWQIPGQINLLNDDTFTRMVNQNAQEDLRNGIPQEEIAKQFEAYGMNYGSGPGGITTTGFSKGRQIPDGPLAPVAGGSSSSAGGSSGSAGGSGAGGSGGSSGGSAGRPNYTGGNGWGDMTGGNRNGPGGLPIVPGATGGADTGSVIDPSKALGIPTITPSKTAGSPYFSGGAGQMPSAGNPFAGLGPGSNLYDVIAKIAGAQVGNQQSAMDIYGGLFKDANEGANPTALRGQVGNLLANPYTMDEQTIQRILGKSTERVNQGANRMMEEARARDASSGLRADSGVVGARQDAIQTNALNQAATGERDIRAQAAIQNGQDLRSAIGTAGGAIDTDLARKQGIGAGAAGVLGDTAISGDAFITNALLAAQGKNTVPAPNSTGYPRGMTMGPYRGI